MSLNSRTNNCIFLNIAHRHTHGGHPAEGDCLEFFNEKDCTFSKRFQLCCSNVCTLPSTRNLNPMLGGRFGLKQGSQTQIAPMAKWGLIE